MEILCPNCSIKLTDANNFCENCGFNLSSLNRNKHPEKLDFYQLTFFSSVILLFMIFASWNRIPSNLGTISDIIITTLLVLAILIILDMKGVYAYEYLLILSIAGFFYSLLLFNIVTAIIAIIGGYFSIPNVQI